MISAAATVSDYISDVPLERQATIRRLRSLCRKILKGYQECMEYGMPCYKKHGTVEVSFASQRSYIALYVLKKDVVNEFRSALGTADIGKGCIRFKKPEDIDFEVVENLLRRSAASDEAICD